MNRSLLNLTIDLLGSSKDRIARYMLEREVIGNPGITLRALTREYLFVSLFRACAGSLASENASRLAAMERADRNIDGLLKELNSSYHQLRQSDIDAELFDVISGFAALTASPRQTATGRNHNTLSVAGMPGDDHHQE